MNGKKFSEKIKPRMFLDYLFITIVIWSLSPIYIETTYSLLGKYPADWLLDIAFPFGFLIPKDAGLGAFAYIYSIMLCQIIGANILPWILRAYSKKINPLAVNFTSIILILLTIIIFNIGQIVDNRSYSANLEIRNERAKFIELDIVKCSYTKEESLECQVLLENVPKTDTLTPLTIQIKNNYNYTSEFGVKLTKISDNSYSGTFQIPKYYEISKPVYISDFIFYDNFDRFERNELKIKLSENE